MNNNLTATIPGSALPDGAPFGYSAGNTQHVLFRSSDNHLHEIFNNGAFWVDNDLTAFIPGSTGAASDPTGYFNGTQHIMFRGTDNHVHELFNGGAFWVNNDLSDLVGGGNPVAGVVGYFSR